MAEIGKKHSRKTKLVPRECIEIEDNEPISDLEEAVLSIPLSEPSTSFLPKIKDTLNKDSFKETSENLSVEVQVEVESCSDEEPVENTIVYNDDEHNFIQTLSKLPKEETVISTDEILEALDDIAKKTTSIVDKQIDIYIRNILGKFVRMHEPDYYETIIQDILAQWRVWVCLSKIRSYVLAYKCNICCLGWWRLGPFEEHIRMHKNLTLQLESFHHDCVIVATNGKWFENVCQPKIEGNCPQCLKDYESHKQQKYNNVFYSCNACGATFSTCKALFMHEGKCVKYERVLYENSKIQYVENHCVICDTNCLTKERYEEHFQEHHDVRSDEPMISQHVPKECGTCGIKYFVYNLHKCPLKQDNFKCSYCCRKFQSKFVEYTHENSYNGSCYCPVCNQYMKKQCMLYVHLLRHSKYYTTAFKCQECSDHVLVTSVDLMQQHKNKYHRKGQTKAKCDWRLFEVIVLPIQCLITHSANSASVVDMVIEKKNKNQKSVNNEIVETKDEKKSREKYEEIVLREPAEIQEKDTKNIENVSKKLANEHKRAERVKNETENNYDAVIQMAVDSLKFDTTPHDKSNGNDNFYDDDLGIGDDDINETESSVNALLLNQFNIKQDNIDIDESDLPPYMFLRESSNRRSLANDDSNQSSSIVVKKELLCEEVSAMEILEDFSIKRETPEPQLMIDEDSQENNIDDVEIETKSIKDEISEVPETDDQDCVEILAPEPQLIVIDDSDDEIENDEAVTKVPENIQTIVSKENENIYETHVTIKQESLDEDEFKALISESERNVASENNINTETTENKETAKQKESVSVEVNIKEEKLDDENIDDEIETEILKEQEACLEELSKVFQAAKSSKEVKLSNICVDEIKVKNEPLKEQEACLEELSKVFQAAKSSKLEVKLSKICVDEINLKNEPMDVDDDFEDDIIVMNGDPTFFKAEALKSSLSDKSTDSLNNIEVNLSHLEPKISLTENSSAPSPSKKNKKTNKSAKKKLYACKKCRFVGSHKIYKLHKTVTCPYLKKSKKQKSKEIWPDMKCSKCDHRFPTLSNYYLHLCYIHNLKSLFCPQCPVEFKSLCQILQHLRGHIRRTYVKLQVLKELVYVSSMSCGVYQCKICAAEIAFDDFFNHWESHLDLNFKHERQEERDENDDEEKKLVIDEGERIITVKQEDAQPKNPDYVLPQDDIKKLLGQLTAPLENKKGKRLKICVQCNRGFQRHNDIKRHVIEHLLKAAYGMSGRGLQCQMCGKRFDKPDAYKVHMRQHGALPLFKCEMCNRCFSDSSNFAKHKKVHNLQALTCDDCGRKFHSKVQLEKHMELHRNTKPLECNQCNRVFTLPTYYKKHMRLIHGPKITGTHCKICRKREPSWRAMWDHMWNVHKIRLYPADCFICDKSFRKYLEVRQHMRREHNLSHHVTIKALKEIQDLSVEERKEKIRELLESPVCVSKPGTSGSKPTYVFYE